MFSNLCPSILVGADRVHIEGPDRGHIGARLTYTCISENSNPPSVIRWNVKGQEMKGLEKKVKREHNVLLFVETVSLLRTQLCERCGHFAAANGSLSDLATVLVLVLHYISFFYKYWFSVQWFTLNTEHH